MIERRRCPVCQNQENRELVSLPYDDGLLRAIGAPEPLRAELIGKEYRLLECAICTCAFQVWAPEDGELPALYGHEDFSASPLGRVRLSSLQRKGQEAIMVRLLFPEKARPVVLDYGTGAGYWPLLARAYGCETWVCDVDPAARRTAIENGITFVSPVEVPENRFDYINSDQVFEHLTDPRIAMDRISTALNPGGVLKISTPGKKRLKRKLKNLRAENAPRRFTRDLEPVKPLYHINLFNAGSMVALAGRAGLRHWRPPLRLLWGSMSGFLPLRQIEYHFKNPFKKWMRIGTWQYFRKPECRDILPEQEETTDRSPR